MVFYPKFFHFHLYNSAQGEALHPHLEIFIRGSFQSLKEGGGMGVMCQLVVCVYKLYQTQKNGS
jgi:hypothetical protein